MSGTSIAAPQNADPLSGTARLRVVAIVAASAMFCLQGLVYSLPLYFNEVGFSSGAWSRLIAFQVPPWCISALLAGLLARRYGERRLWTFALAAQVLVPVVLVYDAREALVPWLAAWGGFSNGAMWVAGMSITQMVPASRTWLANAVVLTALGVGGISGPLAARAVLRQDELRERFDGNWIDTALLLLSNPERETPPSRAAFEQVLMGVSVLLALNAALMFFFGQRPGPAANDANPRSDEPFIAIPTGLSWRGALGDLLLVARQPRYLWLAISLGLFCGPLFMASNMYLKTRAEDFHLIVASQDRGWLWLQFTTMAGQTLGGLAVGLLAGRALPPRSAALVAASFALCMGAMSLAGQAAVFFAATFLFEFLRPSMRWAGAGYLAENAPRELRAIAVGLGVTLANVSMAIFGLACLLTIGAETATDGESEPLNSQPALLAASCIGLAGALLLVAREWWRGQASEPA